MPLIVMAFCWMIGFVIAMKLSILFQVVIFLVLVYAFARTNNKGGLESIFGLVAVLMVMFGMVSGDIAYYLNCYTGPGIDWGWAFRP